MKRLKRFFSRILTRFYLRQIILRYRLADKLNHKLPSLSEYTDKQLLAGILQYAHCKRLGGDSNHPDALEEGYRQYRNLVQMGEMQDPQQAIHDMLNS